MATDPTGGIGQAAGDLLKEMQKAQAEMQQVEQRRQTGGNQAFQQAMQQQQSASQMAQTQNSQKAAEVTQSSRVVTDGATDKVVKEQREFEKRASTRVGATEKNEESKLSQMLENLVNGQDKMTKIMHMALSGKQFSPTDLIAMQAGVYRFSQELDLTSKVVEKATGGIKQTLNTQV